MDSLGNDFDTLLARSATLALLATAVWVALVLAAILTEALSRGRLRPARLTGCPLAWRRWLLAVLAALVVAPTTAARAVEGLPLPDRVVDGAQRFATPPDHRVVVASGDSLWRITRALLPPRAPDAAVAVAVRRLHTHNRGVIGPDPDLLHPGQRLLVPTRLAPDFPAPTTLPEAP